MVSVDDNRIKSLQTSHAFTGTNCNLDPKPHSFRLGIEYLVEPVEAANPVEIVYVIFIQIILDPGEISVIFKVI